MKKQASHWEKIFAKHVSDKGHLCTICEELLKLNPSATNNLLENEAFSKTPKVKNRHLTEEDVDGK